MCSQEHLLKQKLEYPQAEEVGLTDEDVKKMLRLWVLWGDRSYDSILPLFQTFIQSLWIRKWRVSCGSGEPRTHSFCLEPTQNDSSKQRAELLRAHVSCGIRYQPGADLLQTGRRTHTLCKEPVVSSVSFLVTEQKNVSGKVAVTQSVECGVLTGM